ncbi:hypothetical protein SAMN04489761_4601 [Tenacibaculum sp. MAR_2009_124]|uniref:DUF5777 family beta-barrel protein n=1 Tax=Tenacibaculum sp. MAR_2009_124 TaxID=1250059 RepID=UPI0008981872|nr:DUF5777 family beta-barrel protein [Tenacibaculum sp. MAR_2009_124]SED20135.1 hypothetical protein SAMN04489761_4601 [Tenacibaculum sp. MAR_2009_124]
MYYTKLTCTLLLLFTVTIYAQDDLLEELENDNKNKSTFILPAFKTLKIGNLQSTKVAEKGDLYLIVSHRFGPLKEGFDTFLGLDNANTKMELLYSFWDGIQFSISRESFDRTLAATSKFRITQQSHRFPLNITGYAGIYRNTLINTQAFPELKDADRYSYSLQLLVSKRFSKKLTLQAAPTFIRENLQDLRNTVEANHGQLGLGFGGRYKISKRMSFNAEYVHNFNRHKDSRFSNPYTFGLDIETGGHVFQLLFSNAQSTNEPGFISKAEGDIAFGFNVVRVF